jgi:hypothetical protein
MAEIGSAHGTRSRYINGGCRCDPCTEANRTYTAALRDRLLKRPVPPGAHGDSSTYTNWGCRCARCRQAHSDYCRAYKSRQSIASAPATS